MNNEVRSNMRDQATASTESLMSTKILIDQLVMTFGANTADGRTILERISTAVPGPDSAR